MKPGDGLLVELSKRAGVKPPHLFHLLMYRRQMKDSFSVAGYCAFAMMEERHVKRMLAVLDSLPAPTKVGKVREVSVRTKLVDGFTVPHEWLLLARERRFWTLDVCQTEGGKFVLYHQAKGSMMASWKAAWLTWISASWKEDGSPDTAVAGRFEDEGARRAYLERLR